MVPAFIPIPQVVEKMLGVGACTQLESVGGVGFLVSEPPVDPPPRETGHQKGRRRHEADTQPVVGIVRPEDGVDGHQRRRGEQPEEMPGVLFDALVGRGNNAPMIANPVSVLPSYPRRLRIASYVTIAGAALWSLDFLHSQWGDEPLWSGLPHIGVGLILVSQLYLLKATSKPFGPYAPFTRRQKVLDLLAIPAVYAAVAVPMLIVRWVAA